MITLKSEHEIELMRRAGKITAAARAVARDMVKPGVTTQQIDKAVYKFITEQGATPSFLHYNGYPASVCVSVNDEKVAAIETTFGCEQFTGDGVVIKKGKKVFHKAILV